jgi:hypothetical protein
LLFFKSLHVKILILLSKHLIKLTNKKYEVLKIGHLSPTRASRMIHTWCYRHSCPVGIWKVFFGLEMRENAENGVFTLDQKGIVWPSGYFKTRNCILERSLFQYLIHMYRVSCKVLAFWVKIIIWEKIFRNNSKRCRKGIMTLVLKLIAHLLAKNG